MKMRLKAVLATWALASVTGMAWAEPGNFGEPGGCHPLMTERECADHVATLARLPPGDQREAYARAHQELLLERETACACNRDVAAEMRAATARMGQGKQALLRF
jgi:hypothetical protein